MVGRYTVPMENEIGPAFIPGTVAECENCLEVEETCIHCWFCVACHKATLCDEVTA